MTHCRTKIKDENFKGKIRKKMKKRPKNSGKNILERFVYALRQQCQEKYCVAPNFNESSYWNILHLISIAAFCILMTSPLILVPQHNAIKNSEYWYEVIIAVQFSYSLVEALRTTMEFTILFNPNYFTYIKTCGWMYCSLMITMIVMVIPYFAIFVCYLNYNPPMPFTGIIGYLSKFVSLASVWFSIPYEKRIENEH